MPAKVSEYMTAKVISVKPDIGVRQAYFLMRDEAIRHLPVIDEEKSLIGFISDRELRRPNWADESPDIAHDYHVSDDLAVSDVMCTDVIHLNTYDTLTKAVGILLDNKITAAPVLDKNEDLVGMLSAVDLLAAFRDTLEAQKSAKKSSKR
ncbi:HPP family protein [Thaumasiovibrio subtropicus]|uniref:CBS domain-containing protein n=1 Tax=Thaumasiovibrio subtropicus TaxID=1891207 RepID=UPI000B35BAFB|nr:CBS domain-containing protein [Thaumasiovibrio subtropicus]